jgi:hypothetical protein
MMHIKSCSTTHDVRWCLQRVHKCSMHTRWTCKCSNRASFLYPPSLSERMRIVFACHAVSYMAQNGPRCPEGYLVSYLAIYLAHASCWRWPVEPCFARLHTCVIHEIRL